MAGIYAFSMASLMRQVWSGIGDVGDALVPVCFKKQTALEEHRDVELDNEKRNITTKIGDDNRNDGCDNTDEGAISTLTDDALFNIFSLVSLVDRGRIARVCRRWNRIVKDGRLWTDINFWEKTPYLRNPWTEEQYVLQLLKTYVNRGLRTIHLRVIGIRVLLFLRERCPAVKVLSFWPPSWPKALALDSKCRPAPHFSNNLTNNLTHSLYVPKTAVKVQLTFMGIESPNGGSLVEFECGGFMPTLMEQLSCCSRMRHLTLVHCDCITTDGLVLLTESVPELEELWLLNFKHEATEKDTLSSVLRCIAQNLKQLRSFRFICAQLDVDFDEFFHIVSQHGTLRQLWIGRGPYCFSEGAFTELCRSLPLLEELVLESCTCITDSIIECIGTQLKNLKVLNLLASGPYTSESITHLQKHPTLQISNVPGLRL